MKDDECMLRVCFNGGLCLTFLVIAIFSFAIVFILTSRISLRLSSKLHQFNCCNISPALDVFRCLLVMNLAALRWIISS